MKQTGILYGIRNNENGTVVNMPIKNTFIYFSQNGVRKTTTQTDTNGRFDFDLVVGKFEVSISIGASANVYSLAGGSQFELISTSKVDAFEKWAISPSFIKPEENPLVIRLTELVQIATKAATEAQAILNSILNDSCELWHSRNAIVDSNGFIKKASPIIKLFDDHIEYNGQFDDKPMFEKIDTGIYKISNTLGLAKEGWTYEKPRGGGGAPYFHIDIEKLEDGCIISIHDEYETLEKTTIVDIVGNKKTINQIVKVHGQARDIKEYERWIDLRFHEEIKEPEEIESSENGDF